MSIMKAAVKRNWQDEVERYTKMTGISLFGYKSMYDSNNYGLFDAEGYKGRTWKRREVSYGVAPIQTKIVLSWIAKLFISMKELMKVVKEQAGNCSPASVKAEFSNYKAWLEMFKATGNTNNTPDYVAFMEG